MYNEKEILCLLKSNKEKISAIFSPEKNDFELKIRPDLKIKKSKYMDSYRISDTEAKYLEILKLNPGVLRLEYSQMDYFLLISSIPRNKIKLLDGMIFSPEIGFFDDTSTLNISREY